MIGPFTIPWEKWDEIKIKGENETSYGLVNFLTGNKITIEHASATVGKKRGRGKLEPVIPGMTIQIPKSASGDICQSDSESEHNASKLAQNKPFTLEPRFYDITRDSKLILLNQDIIVNELPI